MAFDLPRGPCSLHFTGSVRALAPTPAKEERPADPGALGQARPKGPPASVRPPPASVRPPSPSASVLVSALPDSRVMTPTRLTTLRGPVELVADDEEPITQCHDRIALVLAVLPDGRPVPSAGSGQTLPVPHFRSAALAPHEQRTVIIRRPRDVSLPLAVWIVAAVVAGFVSFHLAPQARASLQQAVRGTAP